MGASTALTLQMLLKGERVLENQDVWARLKGRYDSPICGKYLKQLQCKLLSVLPWVS